MAAQQGYGVLQRIPVLAADAHGFALDGGLDLLLRILDQFDDFLGLLAGNALLQGDLLADTHAHGGLQLLVLE
jgi:hypothetical protein